MGVVLNDCINNLSSEDDESLEEKKKKNLWYKTLISYNFQILWQIKSKPARDTSKGLRKHTWKTRIERSKKAYITSKTRIASDWLD